MTICGNSDIPLDMGKTKLAPDQLGPPGSNYRRPGANANAPVYLKEATLYRPRGGDYAGALGFTDGQGRYVIQEAATGLRKVFDTQPMAADWLSESGLLEDGKALVGQHTELVMGLRRNKAIDEWAAASPLQRVIGMASSNFVGNTVQGAELRAAMDWARKMSTTDRFATLGRFMTKQAHLSPEELRALMPESALAVRSVGWLANKFKWGRINLVDNLAALDDPHFGTAEQRASIRAAAEAQRARAQSLRNGYGSMTFDTQREFHRFLDSVGLTADETISRYRMAQFTLERSRRLENQYRELLKPHLPEHAVVRVIGKDANGKPITEKLDLRKGLGDLDRPFHYDRSEYAELHTDPEAIAELRVRYQNRDNPTQFEWEGKTGIEGAKAYLASLDETKRAHLKNANHFLNLLMDHHLTEAISQGVSGLTRDAVDRLIQNERHYIPMHEDINRVGRESGAVLKGRDTAIENPAERLWTYFDQLSRRNAHNAMSQEIFHTLAQFADRSPDLYRIRQDELKWDEGTQRWAPVTGNGENTGYVWFPPATKGGAPVAYRVDFTGLARTASGRALRTEETRMGEALSHLFNGTAAGDEFLSTGPLKYLAGVNRALSIMWTIARPNWMLKSMAWNAGLTPATVQSAFGLSGGDYKRFFMGEHGTMKPFLSHVGSLTSAALSEKYRASHPRAAALLKFARQSGAGYGHTTNRFLPEALQAQHASVGSAKEVLSRFKSAPLGTAKELGTRGLDKFSAISHSPDEAVTHAAFAAAVEMRAAEHGVKLETLEDMEQFARDHPDDIVWASNGSRRIMPNFANHGNYRWVNALIPFFNASVQTAPMMVRMAKTRTGQIGFGLAVLAGYASQENAWDEHGEESKEISGSGRGIYGNDHFSFPVDYAWGSPMLFGRGISLLAHGQASWGEVAGEVTKGLLNAGSPIQIPDETPSLKGLLVSATPDALQVPFRLALHLNNYGDPNFNESPTDKFGHALVNAPMWEKGRPNDSVWATKVAQFLNYASLGILNLSPGDVGGTVRSFVSPAADVLNAVEGQTASARGETQTAANTLGDILGGNAFEQHAIAGQGQRAFQEVYRERVGASDTKNTLRVNPATARLQRLKDMGDTFNRKATMRLPDGRVVTYQMVKKAAVLAEQDGDANAAAYWRARAQMFRHAQDQVWYRLAIAAKAQP